MLLATSLFLPAPPPCPSCAPSSPPPDLPLSPIKTLSVLHSICAFPRLLSSTLLLPASGGSTMSLLSLPLPLLPLPSTLRPSVTSKTRWAPTNPSSRTSSPPSRGKSWPKKTPKSPPPLFGTRSDSWYYNSPMHIRRDDDTISTALTVLLTLVVLVVVYLTLGPQIAHIFFSR